MTFHESGFFREPAQFTRLRAHVLPRLLAARAGEKTLRVWSAATAAGQEAYSIAMILVGSAAGAGRDGGWKSSPPISPPTAIYRGESGRYAAA